MKENQRIEEKFEEWFWDTRFGFQFKAESCFQWAQTAAEKPDTLNRFLTDWIKGTYEAAYKQGYRDALSSLHYKPENSSGSPAVIHLQ